jgi:hypothetical protein
LPVICIREGFSPEMVAQLGHGGFLMLEYQKSSAAAPKPRNFCQLEYFGQVCLRWLEVAYYVGPQRQSSSKQLWCTNSPNQTFLSRSLWVEAVGR